MHQRLYPGYYVMRKLVRVAFFALYPVFARCLFCKLFEACLLWLSSRLSYMLENHGRHAPKCFGSKRDNTRELTDNLVLMALARLPCVNSLMYTGPEFFALTLSRICCRFSSIVIYF